MKGKRNLLGSGKNKDPAWNITDAYIQNATNTLIGTLGAGVGLGLKTRQPMCFIHRVNTLLILLPFLVPICHGWSTTLSVLGWVPPFHIPLPNPPNQKHRWAEDTSTSQGSSELNLSKPVGIQSTLH